MVVNRIGLYSHHKDSLWKVGWPFPIYVIVFLLKVVVAATVWFEYRQYIYIYTVNMYYFVNMFEDTPFIFEDCHSLEMIFTNTKICWTNSGSQKSCRCLNLCTSCHYNWRLRSPNSAGRIARKLIDLTSAGIRLNLPGNLGIRYSLFSPRSLGKMNPFWRSYFSDGLKPPTSVVKDIHIPLVVVLWQNKENSSQIQAHCLVKR